MKNCEGSTIRTNTGYMQYKYTHILLALYLTSLLLVVSLTNRFIWINGMLEAGGIFVFPLTFLICDIVSEVYGYQLSRHFVWIGAFCEIIFALMATVVVHLPAPSYWHNSESYKTVFDPTIRYVFSALIGLLIGEFINIYILVKWKIKLHGRKFWLRSIIATACGQLVLSIIVAFMAFTGILPLDGVLFLIYCGFIWKMVYAVLLVYPAWLLIKFLKKSEGVDVYDIGVDFNPFKFTLKS